MAATLCSMTGFGRGEAELAGRSLVVELRAVNSRHLDLRRLSPRTGIAVSRDATGRAVSLAVRSAPARFLRVTSGGASGRSPQRRRAGPLRHCVVFELIAGQRLRGVCGFQA